MPEPKVFDVYAMYPDASYLVASGNDSQHATDMADQVLKELGITPWGVATLTRGEHTIRGPVYGVKELRQLA